MSETKSYSLVDVKKFKTATAIGERYAHIHRLNNPISADPNLIDTNDYLIPLNPAYKDYNDAFDKITKSLGIKVRTVKEHPEQDSVRYLGIVLRATNEKMDEATLEIWKQRSLDWLKDTFGEGRLLEVVYHGDESEWGEHIHASVIPVQYNEEKNRYTLNAKPFTNSTKENQLFSNYQTSYAEYVKDTGLVRGEIGGRANYMELNDLKDATHKDYAKELPKPEPGISAQDYYDIAQNTFRNNNLKNGYDQRKMKTEHEKAMAKLERDLKDEIKRKEQDNEALREKANNLREKNDILKSDNKRKDVKISNLEFENETLKKMLNDENKTAADIQNDLAMHKVLKSWEIGCPFTKEAMDACEKCIKYYDNTLNAKDKGEISR